MLRSPGSRCADSLKFGACNGPQALQTNHKKLLKERATALSGERSDDSWSALHTLAELLKKANERADLPNSRSMPAAPLQLTP